jgi:hypothetical protein
MPDDAPSIFENLERVQGVTFRLGSYPLFLKKLAITEQCSGCRKRRKTGAFYGAVAAANNTPDMQNEKK